MTPVSILQQKQRQQEAQKLLQEFLLNWPGETWCTETSKQVLRKSSPSTVELPSPMEENSIREKFMVEQPKKNVSELKFEKCHVPSIFIYWQTNFKTGVCSGFSSSSGSNAMD